MKRRNFRRPISPVIRPAVLICLAYTIFGVGMILQPQRYVITPAYGNLTRLLDMQAWGAIYLTVAVLFGIYVAAATSRTFALATHILGLIVTACWLMAFVIRWLTDVTTTVTNVGTWLVLLAVIVRSAALIPAPHARDEPC